MMAADCGIPEKTPQQERLDWVEKSVADFHTFYKSYPNFTFLEAACQFYFLKGLDELKETKWHS